jgi:hypothetical protein
MSLPSSPIWNPGTYQGARAPRGYFEGWYFKCVDAAGEHPLAVIPGVSWDRAGGTSHSFVQLVRPGGHARYIRYPVEAFSVDRSNPFAIHVGANRFSTEGMSLDLTDDDGFRAVGMVGFGRWTPWPVRLLSPGIMGWYRFVPRMQCYHGVLSLDHELTGSLELDGDALQFQGGRGYVEKDWGTSFPSAWVWGQSNHFRAGGAADADEGGWRPGTSLTLSVARIPWLTGAFTGFIAGLLVDGVLHRFTTYTGASLAHIQTGPTGAHVVLRDRHAELEVWARGALAAELKAPSVGAMVGRAEEALGSTLDVTLRRRSSSGQATVVFEGVGEHAGVEIMDANGELGRA